MFQTTWSKSNYSRDPNKCTGTFIIFWNIFYGVYLIWERMFTKFEVFVLSSIYIFIVSFCKLDDWGKKCIEMSLSTFFIIRYSTIPKINIFVQFHLFIQMIYDVRCLLLEWKMFSDMKFYIFFYLFSLPCLHLIK